MALARMIRRAAPLIVLGVAGAAAARRRAERQRHPQLAPPAYTPPVAEAGPAVAAEPEPEVESDPKPEVEPPPEPSPEPEPGPLPDPVDEQPTEEIGIDRAPWLESQAEPRAEPEEDEEEEASVTEIVDDLLAPGDRAETIEEATVVEGHGVEEPDDDALAAAARTSLAEELPGTVDLEVRHGVLTLSGEVERAEAIAEIERKAAEVPEIRSVKSLLHLPGTPPPVAREHR